MFPIPEQFKSKNQNFFEKKFSRSAKKLEILQELNFADDPQNRKIRKI